MARRPLERERIDLDGGRRTTQLIRDSLGGKAMEQAAILAVCLMTSLATGVAESALPGKPASHLRPARAEPRLQFTTREVHGPSRPRAFVDSVRVRSGSVIIYGFRGLANVGESLTASLLVVQDYVIVEVVRLPGSAIGAIVVPLEYTATVTGLAHQRYRLIVRDMPPDALAALAGYSSIIDVRTGNELDVKRE